MPFTPEELEAIRLADEEIERELKAALGAFADNLKRDAACA